MPLARTISAQGLAARRAARTLWPLPVLCVLAAGCYRDECSPSGASRCEQNRVMQCEEHANGEYGGQHTEWTPYSCSSACLEITDSFATCVESAEKDPLCGDDASAAVCRDGDYVRCSYGYRLSTDSCPASVDWGIADAYRCVDPVPFHAVCVPGDAQIDALCAGGSGPRCDGSTLVQCLDGYGVRTACRSCTIYPPDYYPRWECTGTKGYGCVVDSDCAEGLVCAAQPPSPQGFPSPPACAPPSK